MREQDHEFIATQPCNDVAGPHMGLQALGDGAQYRIARVVPAKSPFFTAAGIVSRTRSSNRIRVSPLSAGNA